MPSPSSRTAISSSPPAARRTSTCPAPASSAFSISSFTTEAGRSMTSPAAIWPCTAGGRIAIFPTPLQDEARVLAREPTLDLFPARLEPGAAHEGRRETLALLHARLTERVDPGERARGHGSHLEEVEVLPERERVHCGQNERRARAPALGKRELRRPLLRVQELAERVAAEIGDALEVLVGRGEVDRRTVIFDPHEDDDLVAWALGV